MSATASSKFIAARAAVALEQSRATRWAKSRWLSVSILLVELGEIVCVGLLTDRFVAQWLRSKPYIDHTYSMSTLLVALALLGYLCVALELFVRHRDPRPSFTFPLVFLPFGRQLRFAVIVAFSLLLLIPKLLVYFVYLTVAIPFVALSSRLFRGAGLRLIDVFDVLIEPLEHALGWLFNVLHFTKLEGGRSIFDPLFNIYLTLWCVNH